MAKAKKTLKTSLKWKKKKWYAIAAPKAFFEAQIGETTAMDDSEPLGKTVQVNLMNLTRNIRQKNINVKFRITKVTGSLCHTELAQYQMSPSIIKRNIRHGNARIDDSFGMISKDSKRAIIKPLIVTKKTTKNSVITAIRLKCKAKILEFAKNMNMAQMVSEIVKGQLQKELYKILSKIYPLKSVHIRSFQILDSLGDEVVEEKKSDKPADKPKEASEEKAADEEGEVSKEAKSSDVKEASEEKAADEEGEVSKEVKSSDVKKEKKETDSKPAIKETDDKSEE